MSYTPQGGATEGNVADDILMVDQGTMDLSEWFLLFSGHDSLSLILEFEIR